MKGNSSGFRLALGLVMVTGCAAEPDPVDLFACGEPGALAACSQPVMDPEHYVTASLRYFDTMDSTVEDPIWPEYAPLVARWEWPPWLLLTAFSREGIHATDTLLKLYPSTIPIRECLAFDTQPFGRCKITFEYEAHDNQPCPIYEEFVFNDAGEVTFIEAWSDVDGLRPMTADDPWADSPSFHRMSGKVPGLGTADGLIDLDGAAMNAAAAADPEIADFVYRAENWLETWTETFANSPDDMWATGCGWNP